MINPARSIIELALLEFGVRYRKLGDELYFCMLSNGLTFDMICSDDGTIRIWRFIDSSLLIEAGTHYTCSKANATLGIKITDEGDVELFVEYRYGHKVPDIEQRIRKMLTEYINMITQYERRKSTVG